MQRISTPKYLLEPRDSIYFSKFKHTHPDYIIKNPLTNKYVEIDGMEEWKAEIEANIEALEIYDRVQDVVLVDIINNDKTLNVEIREGANINELEIICNKIGLQNVVDAVNRIYEEEFGGVAKHTYKIFRKSLAKLFLRRKHKMTVEEFYTGILMRVISEFDCKKLIIDTDPELDYHRLVYGKYLNS